MSSPQPGHTEGEVRRDPVGGRGQRELDIAREIAHAFLNATRAVEVYRLALTRVTPLVGGSFSSVFLRDPVDPQLLKLECAQNWPQSSARFLGQLRIRVGRGPTGRAVQEGRAIAVEDVFADPALLEWWEPARELGFTSLIALPLRVRGETVGALSFYFERRHRFGKAEHELLELVANQLAAAAERAQLLEDLQQANAQLKRQNLELAARVEEAEQARRLKEEFLANMSHELRTPLTAIMGYAYLLAEGHAGPLTEQQVQCVRKIERAGTALLRLIGDLLDLSQLKLGRARLETAVHDAAALARRAVDMAGEPAPGVVFRLVEEEPPLPVETDGEKVVKILENLLTNAFKFTAAGEVKLTVRRGPAGKAAWSEGSEADPAASRGGPAGPGAHGWVEWAVEDTGIGIDARDLPIIFDEFRQVDGSSTRLYGGTGLGLALSQRLARLLGGEITVESEPGRGSTFTLRVPAAVPTAAGVPME
ncbi:MAG TPA: HAMP domain-containing sensor histidine kinase [Longimicrobiales bacterium]